MLILLALLVVNVVTALAFAHDKRAALTGVRRVRESTLLGLAFIGGSPAAVWARHRFRHKTRKQPFATQLDLIAMIHAGVALGAAILMF